MVQLSIGGYSPQRAPKGHLSTITALAKITDTVLEILQGVGLTQSKKLQEACRIRR